MPILLKDLIAQLPSDTEEKVRKAKDKFNSRVRDILRRETRLLFRSKDGTDVSVPVRVVAGLPAPLNSLEMQAIDDRHRVAVLIGPFRQMLTAIRDSGRVLARDLLPVLSVNPQAHTLLDGREKYFGLSSEYADFLLRRLNEFELTRFIFRVNEDVLGIYRYGSQGLLFDEHETRIELYWSVIGLVARDLGLEVEDLTFVVLAHELAHAYTHVGNDADDQWWFTPWFAASAHELKEGLAQFYTLLVCTRMQEGGPLHAFKTLLPCQPVAYRFHERWKESTPEAVRLAMLGVRRAGREIKVGEFENRLTHARQQLKPE